MESGFPDAAVGGSLGKTQRHLPRYRRSHGQPMGPGMTDTPTSPSHGRIARRLAEAEDLVPEPDDGDVGDPGHSYPPEAEDVDYNLLRRCAAEPQSDIGNARRLLMRHGPDMVHIQNIGFFAWDGRRYAEDVDGKVLRPLCHQTVALIGHEPIVMGPTPNEQEAIGAAALVRRELPALEAAIAMADTSDGKAIALTDLRKAEQVVDDGDRARRAVDARRASRRKFAVSSGNSGRINGMTTEAMPYCSHPVDDFDVSPLTVNVGNGTLRFTVTVSEDLECPDPDVIRLKREVEMRRGDHDRADLITKLADVDHEPDALCPEFDRFIARVLPDAAVRDFVQRYIGYAMTGLTGEQVFCIFHGEGNNGKSTFVDVIGRILADYSTVLPIATLVNNNRGNGGGEATPDLARLPGARFVRASEPKEGLRLDESLIKGLISGEPIPVRRLQKEFIDVRPIFKLVISCNRLPVISGNDDGIWRRVRLVPWDVQIAADEIDKGLPDKLWAERSGILNWMIAGACEYLRRGGLEAPDAVKAATLEYRDDSDVVGRFVRAALVVTGASSDTVEAGRLYSAFLIYCRRDSITAIASTTFHRRMPKAATQAGFEKGKASVSVYVGITIRPEFQGEPSHTHHDPGG